MTHNQNRHGHGHSDTEKQRRCVVALSECHEGQKALIRSNADIKTLEMGLCSGAPLSVLRKESGAPSMLVALHGQRYIIPMEIAKKILVKPSA